MKTTLIIIILCLYSLFLVFGGYHIGQVTEAQKYYKEPTPVLMAAEEAIEFLEWARDIHLQYARRNITLRAFPTYYVVLDSSPAEQWRIAYKYQDIIELIRILEER